MPMALTDWSKIDTSRVVFDRKAIAKILPHRDAMALLDGIYEFDREQGLILGYMNIHQDLFWVSGHFPDNPLVPGIVLVEAAAQISAVAYKLLLPKEAHRLMVFGGTDHVRFRGIVRVGDRVNLVAKAKTATAKVSRCETQAVVGNRIVYEGEILGINS